MKYVLNVEKKKEAPPSQTEEPSFESKPPTPGEVARRSRDGEGNFNYR